MSGLDMTSPAGRLVANVMASVAEWEREVISQRTSAALAQAKLRGVLPGRRCSYSPELRQRVRDLRASGLTLQAVADELNAEGLPTAFGCLWKSATVHQLIRSADLEDAAEAARAS